MILDYVVSEYSGLSASRTSAICIRLPFSIDAMRINIYYPYNHDLKIKVWLKTPEYG
jgi:hypothetical protein